jgi:hypothetical protein
MQQGSGIGLGIAGHDIPAFFTLEFGSLEPNR